MSSYIDDCWDDDGGEWVNVGTKKCKGSKNGSQVHTQVILVLVGLPGSGKSYFASKVEKESLSQYVRINQDSLGTRKNCEASCRQALSRGKSVIIDRCNFDATQREHWLAIGKEFGVPCECVVFNYDKEICIRRCKERTNHETVDSGNSAVVVGCMAKKFRPPLPHSGQYQRHVTVTSFRTADEVAKSYLERSSCDH
jgi:predicted kinase